jgi:hypothetical protein
MGNKSKDVLGNGSPESAEIGSKAFTSVVFKDVSFSKVK